MQTSDVESLIRRSQGVALLAMPALWLLMLALHFHALADFFTLNLRYVAPSAADTVHRLMAARHRAPLIHDQHVLGYLSLPVLLLAAFGLYRLGRGARPALAAAGLSLTAIGTIYTGGVFGLYTALMRAVGDVDPALADGAIATYVAATAHTGAYALTRGLAQLSVVGLALQAWTVRDVAGIPRAATLLVVLGCALFFAFWDIDNLMFVGGLCLAAGLWPHARVLWSGGSGNAGNQSSVSTPSRPSV